MPLWGFANGVEYKFGLTGVTSDSDFAAGLDKNSDSIVLRRGVEIKYGVVDKTVGCLFVIMNRKSDRRPIIFYTDKKTLRKIAENNKDGPMTQIELGDLVTVFEEGYDHDNLTPIANREIRRLRDLTNPPGFASLEDDDDVATTPDLDPYNDPGPAVVVAQPPLVAESPPYAIPQIPAPVVVVKQEQVVPVAAPPPPPLVPEGDDAGGADVPNARIADESLASVLVREVEQVVKASTGDSPWRVYKFKIRKDMDDETTLKTLQRIQTNVMRGLREREGGLFYRKATGEVRVETRQLYMHQLQKFIADEFGPESEEVGTVNHFIVETGPPATRPDRDEILNWERGNFDHVCCTPDVASNVCTAAFNKGPAKVTVKDMEILEHVLVDYENKLVRPRNPYYRPDVLPTLIFAATTFFHRVYETDGAAPGQLAQRLLQTFSGHKFDLGANNLEGYEPVPDDMSRVWADIAPFGEGGADRGRGPGREPKIDEMNVESIRDELADMRIHYISLTPNEFVVSPDKMYLATPVAAAGKAAPMPSWETHARLAKVVLDVVCLFDEAATMTVSKPSMGKKTPNRPAYVITINTRLNFAAVFKLFVIVYTRAKKLHACPSKTLDYRNIADYTNLAHNEANHKARVARPIDMVIDPNAEFMLRAKRVGTEGDYRRWLIDVANALVTKEGSKDTSRDLFDTNIDYLIDVEHRAITQGATCYSFWPMLYRDGGPAEKLASIGMRLRRGPQRSPESWIYHVTTNARMQLYASRSIHDELKEIERKKESAKAAAKRRKEGGAAPVVDDDDDDDDSDGDVPSQLARSTLGASSQSKKEGVAIASSSSSAAAAPAVNDDDDDDDFKAAIAASLLDQDGRSFAPPRSAPGASSQSLAVLQTKSSVSRTRAVGDDSDGDRPLGAASSSSKPSLLRTAVAVASKAAGVVAATITGKEPAVTEQREWCVSVNSGTNTDWVADFETRNRGAITVVTTSFSSSRLLVEIVAILRSRTKSSRFMGLFGSGPSFDPAAVRIVIFPPFAKHQDDLIGSIKGCEMYLGVSEDELAARLKRSGRFESQHTESWIKALQGKCDDTIDMIETFPHATKENVEVVFKAIASTLVDQDYELAWSSVATSTRQKQLYFCLGVGRIKSLGRAMAAMIDQLKTTKPSEHKQLMLRFNLYDFRL